MVENPGSPDPVKLFFWTFRRNERDVVNLYGYLSGVMRIATGGSMLNFGYWNESDSPLQAQRNLCKLFGDAAKLEPGQNVIDVGSGYCTPAKIWQDLYSPGTITCVDINSGHLSDSGQEGLHMANATATHLPFESNSADRVLAFESAQHFKPLDDFVGEAHRILKPGGILAVAIPVIRTHVPLVTARLGLLSMTWSSEHYTKKHVISLLEKKFKILEHKDIGSRVYEPLADYYVNNRASIRPQITRSYPDYVERILYESIKKMGSVSKNKTIDYLIISCQK